MTYDTYPNKERSTKQRCIESETDTSPCRLFFYHMRRNYAFCYRNKDYRVFEGEKSKSNIKL
jgi:hypothetical protein